MTTLEIANNLISRLNEEYQEQIFALRYHDEEEAVIYNDMYRYEGNDVDIHVSESEICGNASGQTIYFCDEDHVIEEIDQLFINE